jgi:hypothetical protein
MGNYLERPLPQCNWRKIKRVFLGGMQENKANNNTATAVPTE